MTITKSDISIVDHYNVEISHSDYIAERVAATKQAIKEKAKLKKVFILGVIVFLAGAVATNYLLTYIHSV